MKLSDEDKELLTADELAAYEADPDGDDEDAEDAADDEGSTADESDDDTGDDDGDDGDDGDDEQPAKPAPADKAPANAQPEASEATAEADEEVAEAKPAAAYTFNAPADIADKLSALKTEERDAFKSLMEGEMTAEDYQAIKERTETERETLQAQKLKAELSAEMSQQQDERDWQNACNAFAAKIKATDGIDYEANRVLGRALDAEVRDLAANPDNANKPAEWFLAEAHKAVKAAMGVPATTTKPAAPTPPQRQRPNPAAIPPSLSKLPAAAESPTTDDKWAHLRNLSPAKYEKAIAAMSDTELDEFMSSEA